MCSHFLIRACCLLGLIGGLLAGCATAPNQELSDTRQAIQAAQDAGAEHYAPTTLDRARLLLGNAEQAVEDDWFDLARVDAVASKHAAVSARNIALAISAAETALAGARALGVEWRDSRDLLERAKAAAGSGDESAVVKFSGEASLQAAAAINQYYLQAVAAMLRAAEPHRAGMTAEQRAMFERTMAAYRQHQGRKAHDLASALMESIGAG